VGFRRWTRRHVRAVRGLDHADRARVALPLESTGDVFARMSRTALSSTFYWRPIRPPKARKSSRFRTAHRRPAAALRAADVARGVGRRIDGELVWSAESVLADPLELAAHLLARPTDRLVVSSDAGPALSPPSLHPLVTLNLGKGERLHSNGPVVLVEDLRREGHLVKGWIKIRLPRGLRRRSFGHPNRDYGVDGEVRRPDDRPARPAACGRRVVRARSVRSRVRRDAAVQAAFSRFAS
jgi:hypothetical protein